jgi:hypothetical protein
MFTPSFSYQVGKGRELESEQRHEASRLRREAIDPAASNGGVPQWVGGLTLMSLPEDHQPEPRRRSGNRLLHLLVRLLSLGRLPRKPSLEPGSEPLT